MKKGCELCSNPARILCDSDQASLCWDCDDKVHAANFLVAKHSRTLLCHVCQSPTPWSAAGPNLGRTLSVCHACSLQGSESDNDESEEDGENQVVPWPHSGSSSASQHKVSFASGSKRSRTPNSDDSEDEDGSCSSPNYTWPLKMYRVEKPPL
ncbi:hypothetical protein ACS0TY_018186 [Phlomoides rotata]